MRRSLGWTSSAALTLTVLAATAATAQVRQTYPVGYWQFNGKEWVYQQGNGVNPQLPPKPNNGVGPAPAPQPQAKKFPPLPKEGSGTADPTAPQPPVAPSQPATPQPQTVIPPKKSPVYGGSAYQTFNWVVLIRHCPTHPWREVGCYSSYNSAFRVAEIWSCRGYFAAVACRH